MKKNVLLIPVCILALAFLMPATAHCQGFLKKLKQKVENAVVGTDESEDNMDRDSEEGETENATKSPGYQRPVQQTHPATATGERKAETTGKAKPGRLKWSRFAFVPLPTMYRSKAAMRIFKVKAGRLSFIPTSWRPLLPHIMSIRT